jgi:hypothetical protein
MTWGPIIEHDGKGCPVPVGTMVRDWTTFHRRNHPDVAYEGPLIPGDIPAWDWSNFAQKDPSDGLYWGRVIRYQVMTPDATQMLRDLAKDVELVDA